MLYTLTDTYGYPTTASSSLFLTYLFDGSGATVLQPTTSGPTMVNQKAADSVLETMNISSPDASYGTFKYTAKNYGSRQVLRLARTNTAGEKLQLDLSGYNLGSVFTVEMLFKGDSTSTSEMGLFYISNGETAASLSDAWHNSYSGVTKYWWQKNYNSIRSGDPDYTDTGDLGAWTRWFHLTFSFGADLQARVYLDGQLIQTKNLSGFTTLLNNVKFMKFFGRGQWLQGIPIDVKMIRILKGAITTTSEATDLMNKTIFALDRYDSIVIGTSINSAYSDPIVKLTLLDIPTLTKSNIKANQMRIGWNDISGAKNYLLQKSDLSNNNYIDVIPYLDLSYGTIFKDITSLTDNTVYYYRIRAINGVNDGDFSNDFYTITLLVTPVISAVANSDRTIDLSWNAISGNTSYTVEYADNSGFVASNNVTGILNTYATIIGLKPYTTYYIRVKAVNINTLNDSELSTETTRLTDKGYVYINNTAITSRVYNGSLAATVSYFGDLSGVDVRHVVTLDSSSVFVQFQSKNVGTNLVDISGYKLAGANANNYILLPPTTVNGIITKKTITVKGPDRITTIGTTIDISINELTVIGGGLVQNSFVTDVLFDSSYNYVDFSYNRVTRTQPILPNSLVIKSGGIDNTQNYDISYSSGILTIKLIKPLDISANNRTDTTLDLTWYDIVNPVIDIDKYRVSYKKPTDSTWIDLATANNTQKNLTLTGLSPNTEYEFKVKALSNV